MSLLERTAHKSHCPYKGDAAYYTIRADGRAADNAIWTYENPYPEVAPVEGHLAFYPDRGDRLEGACQGTSVRRRRTGRQDRGRMASRRNAASAEQPGC